MTGGGAQVPGELTAELRWWWQGDAPRGVQGWFAGLGEARPEQRRDVYCVTDHRGWGLKRRGVDGPWESKMALARQCRVPGLPDATLWLKQEVVRDKHSSDPELVVEKDRQVVALEDAEGEPACEIELGRVRVDEREEWSTLCFEARAHLSDPVGNLARAWNNDGGLPEGLASGWAAAYPEWIAHICREKF
ncbi:hypothetical protein [Aurantiacibacter hainanensis]|uniref:hypothetical protein n=1 Tax=Aurantiacibacter hainanensis TaxID=3076114 RepID=UPI0030C7347E